MKINDVIYNAELMDILLELQSQLHLNNIPLLNEIKDSGNNVMINCPYHKEGQERKPSFGIYKETGIGHCFTCGEVHLLPEVISYCFGYDDHGMFGRQWLLKNFASIEVEDRKDVCLDFRRCVIFNVNSITGSDRNCMQNRADAERTVTEEELDKYRYYHPYWTKRGIVSEWIIELFDLGYDSETSCITFPCKDINGNCLFVARRSVKTKWFNYPADSSKPVYGAWELTQLSEYPKEVYITESMLDCLKLWEFGKFAVALNGLGARNQYEILNRMPCRKFILATDMDEAGKKARIDLRNKLKGKLVTELIWDGSKAKDCNDMDLDFFENETEEVF